VPAFGEMVAVLWAEGKREAAVQLEQLWSDFTRAHSVSLLCAYPLAHFSRSEDQRLFSQICAEHSSVVPAEGFAELVAEDQKTREIAHLQQRAQSLAIEVEARKAAEDRLRVAQAELEGLVEQRTTALRKLSLQVLKLQDLERRRIARELHDSLGQEFVGLRVNLDLAKRRPYDAEHWKQCDQLLERCIDEVRTLSYLLHPPMIEDAGFASAAEWYIEDFSRRSGMNITFSTSGDVSRLPEYLKLVLFRVLQEALLNVHRHARAAAGEVRVQRSANVVVLEVKDNGVGIPADKLARFNRNGTGMGVGLTGMRERVRDLGGRFELNSAPGGTLVRVSVPASRKP
jgi:signal transduction histidine kinase